MPILQSPKHHIGAQLVNEPGTLCWNELRTKDLQGASSFYIELFGWKAKKNAGVIDSEYTEFFNGDRPAAGMLQIQKEWGDMPPHWSVYFAVANCDTTLETAKGQGGKVQMPPTDIKDVGRFAALQDPQGAHFGVIQLK